jgi:hypothetical protein
MRWRGRRESSNIEDRRGQGGGFGGLGRGGFGGPRIRFPVGGKVGGLGIVGIIAVVALYALLGGVFGGDFGGVGGYGDEAVAPQTAAGDQPSDEPARFVAVVLADTEETWHQLFQAGGGRYQEPTLVLFTGQVRSACGGASSASGPFYCPGDRKIYIDLGFYDELRRRFGAPGDFAQAYVIAHEVGHHVQTLLGIEGQVRQAQARASERERNAILVRLELQADCFAGIWAHHADRGRQLLEQGDLEEALRAAQAIGDDAIQKQATGRVVPDAFTHGSSEQRARWFRAGFEAGTVAACDTFAAKTP